MHDTAERIGAAFLRHYSKAGQRIVEIGSYDVNGTIRPYAHPDANYIGLDVEEGPGVDIVSAPDTPLPFDAKSVDIVLASSVFEHDTFFWNTFLDVLRILKDSGIIYISAPSNGTYHRYPNDNWRFYPDAGKSLERWGRKSGYDVHLIESFIAERESVWWNDFVAVFQCAPVAQASYFLSDEIPCTNVWRIGASEPVNVRPESEDLVIIDRQRRQIDALQKSLEQPERPSKVGASVDKDVKRQQEFIAMLKRTMQPAQQAELRLQKLLENDAA